MNFTDIKIIENIKIEGDESMRIDAYNQVSQIYSTTKKYKTQQTTHSMGKDQVEISDFGKVYQSIKKAVNETSDVREDKVADLKKKINNGTYDVSAESFADKLIENYNKQL